MCKPTIQDVIVATAHVFNMPVEDLMKRTTRWEYSHPRQLAMYLARKHTGASLTRIGRAFANRDHTTVIHACRVVRERVTYPPGAETVYLIEIEMLWASGYRRERRTTRATEPLVTKMVHLPSVSY